MMCVFKKIAKMRENFRIYVSGPNSNFRTFQDQFQNFRTTPRPAYTLDYIEIRKKLFINGCTYGRTDGQRPALLSPEQMAYDCFCQPTFVGVV